MSVQVDNETARTLKAVGRFAAKLVLGTIKRMMLLLLKLMGVPAAIMVLIFFCITIIFAYPKAVAEIWGSDPPVFNVLDENDPNWNKEKNTRLIAEYKQYADTWRNGLTKDEQEQAETHAMSWGVLAGVDRILGDPLIHNQVGYKPNPKQHYEALAPKFEWKQSEITTEEEVVVQTAEGKKTETKITKTPVRLLTSASTFEGTFTYEYEWQTIHEGKRTITKEVETNMTQSVDYGRLRSYLAQYGVMNDLDLQMALEYAEMYDEGYAADSAILNNRLLGFEGDITKSTFTGPRGEAMIMPVRGSFTISQNYGPRIHPITKKRVFHTGVDIPEPNGTPAYSVYNGVVVFSSSVNVWGNLVIIDHGNGMMTWYAHLDRRLVIKGQEVNQGDLIGNIGSTGWSTGPHLHFEIRQNGTPINPNLRG